MINTDASALACAVAGDARAVDALLFELRPMVHRFCAPRVPLRGDIDVEDVTQGVMIAVTRMLPTFEVRSVNQFVSAVIVIAQRKLVEARRRPRRDIPVPLERMPEAPTYLSPERVVGARAQLDEIATVLASLSANQRTVTVMRAAGMRATEVGAAMGRPASWVRATHCRAISTLRAVGGPSGGDSQ